MKIIILPNKIEKNIYMKIKNYYAKNPTEATNGKQSFSIQFKDKCYDGIFFIENENIKIIEYWEDP